MTATSGFRPEDFGIGKLFTRIQDAVIVGDARSGHIVLWNPAAEKLFGYEAEDALQMKIQDLVPEEFREAHVSGLERFNRTGRGELIDSGTIVELPALSKDGTRIDIEFSLSRIGGANEEMTPFVLAILRDVSFRKEAERLRAEQQTAELQRIHGLELQDNILQGLAVAKLALELGEAERAGQALQQTLAKAQELVSELLKKDRLLEPGHLIRREAATLHSIPKE